MDNLRLIDYSTADCEAIANLRDRLHQLYSQKLEETARAVLEKLLREQIKNGVDVSKWCSLGEKSTYVSIR